ncbi:MAG: hypothetical protein BZY87_03585 [SAR202 cluster bacterium Io17-Chloro-G6]|nr:MAG: hypothetical protein BZY87_03585 [SAR202 cluster bacterium Io17-Chloro-G6]
MARVTWTEQALDDLDAILLFIARDSTRYSQLFTERVFAAAQQLVEFPMSGRVVPEFGQEHLRELIIQSYRIIYWFESDEAQILAVHHGAIPMEEA